ncbi:MAG TPA: hypothetical protein VFV91_11890 [Gaiellaceae bacterium]|nr:hypothetical protein [Gaiellaceae bacterium]
MKRYVLAVAAILAVALAAADRAQAGAHHRSAKSGHRRAAARHARRVGHTMGHGLVPSFAPHPRVWPTVLREFPRNPTPPHRAKPAHRGAARRQPRLLHRLRATTLSIYEHTAKRSVLAAQGCSAAHRHENGVVVLDFGKPAFEHGGYGTILFSGRFATNHKLTAGMLGYARGYVRCLPQGSTASIELARGTSNYHPAVPSAYTTGVRWARETNKLGRELAHNGLDAHVEAAAADDAEPAWDRSFRKTRHFFHGFRAAVHGHTLYDYGSLDGGVGAIWSARQAWYVAGGLRHTKALPEIYNSAMAREWAELARIARGRYHRAVHFAGVMTQGTSSCNCGLRPPAAHRVLARALVAQGVGQVLLPAGGTNIVG